MGVKQKRVVGWFCDRDGATAITSGFVAENEAYVKAHKDCNWRPLMHPDAVAELVEALHGALKTAEFEGHAYRPWHDEARRALANVGATA